MSTEQTRRDLEQARKLAAIERDPSRCPESVHGDHSPLDAYGKCSWCGRKAGSKAPRPPGFDPGQRAESYREHWNPDWTSDY